MHRVASTPFEFDVLGELRDPAVQAQARQWVTDYFADVEPGFTGRFFEVFATRSPANEFTADDLVAVSTLSVAVPPRAAAILLLPSARRDHLNELLSSGPSAEETLWEAPQSALDESAPLSTLYNELRSIEGIGPTAASKLLAAKRPHFVPIRDAVVERLLGAGNAWWRPMRELVAVEELRDIVGKLSEGVVPDNVSLLRRLDVILWMMGRGAA